MTRARGLALIAAVLAPVAVGAVLGSVRPLVADNNAALVFVLVVVAVAATGNRAAGLLAALASAASFDFFLTRPYLTFAIDRRDDVEAVVLLAVIGLAVTEVALRGRRQQAQASARAGYLEGVVAAARLAASGASSPAQVVELVGRQISDVLDLDDCRFDRGASRVDRPRLHIDGSVTWRGVLLDVERHGLPTLDVIELPATSGGAELGRYLLTSTSAVRRPDRERRQVAVVLAGQAAAVLSTGAPTPRSATP